MAAAGFAEQKIASARNGNGPDEELEDLLQKIMDEQEEAAARLDDDDESDQSSISSTHERQVRMG